MGAILDVPNWQSDPREHGREPGCGLKGKFWVSICQTNIRLFGQKKTPDRSVFANTDRSGGWLTGLT
jgi:hypothetical protein